MAESAVYLVLSTLADPIIQEAKRLHRVTDDVDWLASELRWMECFLEDAEGKRRGGSKLINNWIREVREVAHLAKDIIDTFMVAIEPLQRRQRSTRGRIARYVCLPFELKPRHQVGAEIQQLRAKIQRIKDCRETYGLVDLGQTTAARPIDEALHARRRIAPRLDNDDTVLVGFDAHKKAMIKHLLDPDVKQRCVVSIVGTGGIGKTTLATKIYNDSKIRYGFDIRACVSVSQAHQFDDMLRRMAKQVMDVDTQSMEIDDLQAKLYEFLKPIRYLIVLDDVWSPDVWDQTSKVLPDMKNGSRVLVTSRSMEVATSACTCIQPYELPLLDDQQSWELFLKNTFPQIEDAKPLCCPEALEDAGRKLVKRCGGLPLALVVIGGLLSRKDPCNAEWARVADRMDWASTKAGQHCLDVLALSYDDLPHHHLKSCFLYLAVYPKDHEIREYEVINLWVAEGLIPETRTRTMEETARCYLNELVGRSMIQLNYLSYSVHDLFHDFCTREARKDDFLDVYCPNSPPGEMRLDRNPCHRLSLHDLSSNEMKNWWPAPNLRSLLAIGTKLGGGEILALNGLRLLRVVHLETRHLSKEFSFTIFQKQLLESSIHLRYLCLCRFWQLTELPSSIGSLCNLQTLDISRTEIRGLPESIGKIQTLRHLYLPGDCECTPDICKLANLRTLYKARARGGWIEEGSEKLINIERLGVRGLLSREGEVLLHSLGKMRRLAFLHLDFNGMISPDSFMGFSNLEQLVWVELLGRIPEVCDLVLPPNLTTLVLVRCELKEDPMPVLEKLPNLTTLRLSSWSYEGNGMICAAGGFPSLQQLAVEQLEGLDDWRVEGGAMPKLNRLRIERCKRLAILPEGLQHLTSLKRLEVFDNSIELMRRLEREVGEDWRKIRHVPTISHSIYGLKYIHWRLQR